VTPLIAITMGDPCGIGPEILLKAFCIPGIFDAAGPDLDSGHDLSAGILAGAEIDTKSGIFAAARFLIVGDGRLLRDAADRLDLSFRYDAVKDPEEAEGPLSLLDLHNASPGLLFHGEPCADAGRASAEYVLTAARLAMEGRVHALVTAPIAKAAVSAAGFGDIGHTELLARETKAKRVAMMLVGGGLRVSLCTTHIPLRDVPYALKTSKIRDVITLTHAGLKDLFAIARPRIGVAALNPHGGEGGMFGSEETEVIAPAVIAAREDGIDCRGPLPADTLFQKARTGAFDAIVSMYHDQGLIALKLLSFGKGVNLTLGLPILRTSVDHGTAYDIAGTNRAHPGSLIEAIRLVLSIMRRRKSFT
jgi:4-hydroxythreonine-4-phosphate dehydrogenase